MPLSLVVNSVLYHAAVFGGREKSCIYIHLFIAQVESTLRVLLPWLVAKGLRLLAEGILRPFARADKGMTLCLVAKGVTGVSRAVTRGPSEILSFVGKIPHFLKGFPTCSVTVKPDYAIWNLIVFIGIVHKSGKTTIVLLVSWRHATGVGCPDLSVRSCACPVTLLSERFVENTCDFYLSTVSVCIHNYRRL